MSKKRTQTPELEVHLLREGIVESIHKVHALICDHRGRILSFAGDSETGSFIRSSLKPFQALPVVKTGALEHFKLTDKDLAIICSSHQGTIQQARQVFNILWRANIEPSALQCPIPPGKRSPLEYNCSGKHAGMLAVCQQSGWTLNNYMRHRSAIQELILSGVGELLQMPGAEFIAVQDDCGVPTYFMQLSQMATLYAHLSSGDDVYLERISRAMTHYPEMVAGEGEFDTELMRVSNGELVSKSGAEGVQCIGRIGEGMGLAIKALDGSKRAKYATAIDLLMQMGWITPTMSDSLAEKFMSLSEYKRLEVVGELGFV
ncbi:asparaginase [Dactylococcopsis salina]|uniref:L-asparaginase II n=1 Tax=Dactylococcopsis salina (strain PCC 8305) TaxID=13035 RepID=K9YWM3_DACS8|nr:asparaginase [Dactylococcopsis salina]AFZ50523.1 L-asparaginase II [Dactylococcopsis salina PCC 8305]